MDFELFSNEVGFNGKVTYSLNYMKRCRDLRNVWPRNNVFAGSSDSSVLMKDIFNQPVGVNRCFTYESACNDLKNVLQLFLHRHQRTNYKLLLKKSFRNKISDNRLQNVPRHVLKNYLHRLIFNVIPFSLFGSKENVLVFERNLRRIIFLGKSQVFSLNMVMYKVCTRNRGYLRSINGNLNKTNLLAKLHVWLIRVYIFAAIKSVFYVVESNYSNKYLFYEKRIWQIIQQRRINKISKEIIGVYRNCIIQKVVEVQNLYVLKILPKWRGSRPIYVKWKYEKNWKRMSAFTCNATKQVLYKLAKDHFQNVFSSSNAFHSSWRSMVSTWILAGKPAVYFVRADFLNAFGNIDQLKLMDMLTKIQQRNSDISEIVYEYRKCKRKVSVEDVFKILKNYIKNFVYKSDKVVYRLAEGISQGGFLSSLLCNFYLGELDIQYLTEFTDDKEGFFIRNCDDYLYIAFDREKVTRFLQTLEQGFPEFNMHVNKSKTESNILDESQVLVSFRSYQIDIQSFQLYGCYKSYHKSSIFHSYKFLSLESPGKIIMKRLLSTCSLKLHEAFLDTEYNTTYTVLYNVFQAASLSATRYFLCMNRLFTHYNHMFIFSCIWRCSTRISKITIRKISQKGGIRETMLQWIILKAFVMQLRKIKTEYFSTVMGKINRFLKLLHDNFTEWEREITKKFFLNVPEFCKFII